ncbi:DNA replication/repair protein RecF [Deferribacteraceae bacterium V6Fe1]|nr:DNA replication/repair protein RecF [Deferribacteraceae bacterium V6Fe1]
MFIKKLRIVNFRNHKDSIFAFDKINYVSGKNGTGKTSLAEAISVILTLKSFRQHNFKKIISFDSDFLYLNAKLVDDKDNFTDIKFKYDKKKELFINDNKEPFDSYIKDKLLFTYSPENEGILSKNQKDRRSFIDRVIFYKNFDYLSILKKYNKLLEIKKNILESGKIDKDYLDVINEELLSLSLKITDFRVKEIKFLNKKLSQEFNNIFKNETFEILIKENIPDKDNFKKEIFAGKILSGCHLDKIYFSLNGKIYEDFASFGQRKTFSLITLASILLSIEDFRKSGIILVLDDFEVGLDSERIGVFKSIFEKYQLIITGVENRYFKNANNITL